MTYAIFWVFKLHVYGKWQTSDSSWEFRKIENENMKTAQNNSCGWKIAQNYWFMNRNNEQYKRKVQRKLGHLVKILVSVWRKRET